MHDNITGNQVTLQALVRRGAFTDLAMCSHCPHLCFTFVIKYSLLTVWLMNIGGRILTQVLIQEVLYHSP